MPRDDDIELATFEFDQTDLTATDEVGLVLYTDEDLFDRHSEPMPDPAADLEADLDDVARGFRERAGRENTRLNTWVVSGNYLVLVFATAEQRRAFLTASKWGRHGTVYIDGCLLAERLGFDLPPTPEWRKPRVDKDYADRALRLARVDQE